MHLLVGHTPYSDSQALETMLESCAGQRLDADAVRDAPNPNTLPAATPGAPILIPADAAGSPDRIGDWMEATDTAHLIIFQTPPEAAIARALTDDDTTVTSAIEAWAAAARILLATVRRNRRRATLFDAEAAKRHPDAFAAALAERLGVNRPDAHALSATDGAEVDELHRIIAAQAVARSTDLQDLRDELEAASIPLAEAPAEPLPDCDLALQTLRDQQQARAKADEENELLLQQLHQVQEELEGYYREAQEKATAHREATEENERLTRERDEANARADKVAEETRAQTEKVETLEKTLNERTGERDQQAQRAADRQQEIDRLTTERDETNQKATDAAEENELLLLQLHQVQEELESYYLEAQEKESARRQAAEENERLQKRCDELQRERDSFEYHLGRTRQWIADIKNSRSWKLTTPLRAFGGRGRNNGKSAEGT